MKTTSTQAALPLGADFWRLWQGQLVSHLGLQAFHVMALFWLAQTTGTASAGAAFLAMSLLPPVLLGPTLTRWSERWSVKRTLVGCDIASATATLPLLLGVLLSAPAPVLSGLVLLTAAGLGLVNAIFLPTLHAALPQLVAPAALTRANSWVVTSQQLASVAGQGLGGVAYAVLGPAALCLLNTLGFSASAAALRRLGSSALETCRKSAAARPGWGLLRTNRDLRRFAVVAALFNALYAPWLVLLPFHLSSTQAPGSSTDFGASLVAYGLGTLFGAWALRRFVTRDLTHHYGRALLIQGLLLGLLGVAQGLPQVVGALFAMGIGIGIINVLTLTLTQRLGTDVDRAATVAVLRASVHLATPLGYGLAALSQATFHLPTAATYLSCAAGLVVVALVNQRSLKELCGSGRS